MKILIVEDEKDIATAIKKGLEAQFYTVEMVHDGYSAVEMIEIFEYDLIILDLNLPNLDGISVLNRIRQLKKYIKVLILSAKSSVDDRVLGLEQGANDYLVKPFYFQELLARVSSLLRRDFIQKDQTIVCGDFSIDTKNKQLHISDKKIKLSNIQYQIVEFLMHNKNHYVSTEELFEHIYDSEKDTFSNSIKVHINAIRKKAKEATEKEFIKNTRGLGYMIEDINL